MLLTRKISLTELSQRVGISITNLSNLKTNKARAIRFTTLDAICKVLECQPGDILARTDPSDVAGAGGTASAGGD
jgi:putative transcriptional regulator